MERLIIPCEQCGHGFQPTRVYRVTASNRPRYCSAACRGRGYRARTVLVIEEELQRAQRAIERARDALRTRSEKKP